MRAWSEDYSVKAYQETSDALRYHGRWRRAGHAAYLGDGARYTERRGASVQIRFRGTGVSWVGPKGPTRGKAKVYLDGRLVKTVDSYAASFHPTQILYRVRFGKYDTHTLKIVALGTAGREMVAVDAIIVRGKRNGPKPHEGDLSKPDPTKAPAEATPEPTPEDESEPTPEPEGTAAPTAAPAATPRPTSAPTATPRATTAPTAAPTPKPTQATTGTVVAVGDLASAIANAPNGATLLLRGGTHTLSSYISTSKSLTIQNYPGEVPVITHSTRRPDFLYFRGGPVVIRGITFKAGGPTFDDSMGSAVSEVDGGHDVLYDNVTFYGDPDMSERQQLLYVRYGRNVTIRNCKFIANGTDGFGVHVYPGESTDPHVIVEDSTFTGFGVSAAITSSSRVTIRDNTFRDSRLAIQLRSYASKSVITGNTTSGVSRTVESGSGVSSVTQSGNSWN